jgi:hypothetical protein
MKAIFLMVVSAVSFQGTCAQAADLTVYKCDYTVVRAGQPNYTMSGNIVAQDVAGRDYAVTYLSLAPTQSSRVALEARILITTDGYNPIGLHKPGNSGNQVASTQLTQNGGHLNYQDADKTSYIVDCVLRN